MDFVDWCTSVLNKLIDINSSERDAWYTGVRIDALAMHYFGRNLYMLAGTKQGQALVDASSELERLGLIARKDKVGQWLEVSRNGQEFADDVIPIWEQICSKRLKPEQEELLRGINESMTQNRIEQVLTRLTSPLVEVKYKIINYRLGPVGQIEVLRAKHGINSRQT